MASIQKRGAVYRVRITRKGYATLSNTFTNRQDALRWARNTETQIDAGQIKPIGASGIRTMESTTFGMACEHYERTHTRHKQNRRSEALILKALTIRLGGRPINKIGQLDIAQLRDELLHKGRSGTTVAHYLNAVSKVFQMLKAEWGLDIANPVTGIKRPKPNPPRIVRLNRKAIDTLLQSCEAASEPLLSPIVKVALETGMRRGEILSLQWNDVDYKRRRIYVNRSKNGLARCVPASRQVLEVFEGIPKTNGSFIFPVGPESMRKHYERAVCRAKAQWSCGEENPFTNLTFHDLRHQALSQLSDRGLNVIELSEISGHKTLSMLKRYVHPSHAAILSKLNAPEKKGSLKIM
jgi:integrase